MTPLLVMLASPLLGPAAWQPVADRLSGAGWQVLPPVGVDTVPRGPDDVLRAFAARIPAGTDVVLIPHSNAGLYVPALTAVRQVTGSVFVDARLPARTGTALLGPPAMREFLGPKADDAGILPPWSRWWDDVAPLFPDDATRERVEREQLRLPLSYFEQTVDVPPGWADRPGAYLAFGDTYRTDRERAHDLGWPVSTVPHARHLHMLMRPDRVATEIERLLRAVVGVGSADAAAREPMNEVALEQ